MTDKYPINVKQSDLDKIAQFVRDRVRNLVLEHTHVYDHGKLAGMMSDLRALNYIQPTDAAPAAPAQPKTPSKSAHDRAQQKANAAHDEKEREQIRAASE